MTMVNKLVSSNNDPRAVNIIGALNKQNEDLRPDDRMAKYKKMKESAFVFYRKTG